MLRLLSTARIISNASQKSYTPKSVSFRSCTRYASTSCSPLNDGVSLVQLLNEPQSDLTVVNAARVSFSKKSNEFTTKSQLSKGSDEALIEYLAKHNHWTPFAHVSFLFLRVLPKNEFIDYMVNTSKYQLDRYIFKSSEMKQFPALKFNGSSVYFLERGSLYAYAEMFNKGLCTEQIIVDRCHSVAPFSMKMLAPNAIVSNQQMNLSCVPLENSTVGLKNFFERIGIEHDCPTTQELFDSLTTVQFRIAMPLFVERQYFKHVVGAVRNSESRRYITEPPKFFIPKQLRMQSKNKKQGSHGDIEHAKNSFLGISMKANAMWSVELYDELNEQHVCHEQSRIVLPQNMYTTFIETGTVSYYKRMIGLRTSDYAQNEIRCYAESIANILRLNGILGKNN